jgi:broad specificity phosphatase PhoE
MYDNPRSIYPGRLPVQLSEEGMEQAERLRKYFADKDIQKIYSSAVLRCKQTSETIADKKIPIQFDKRLLETFSAYQGFWGADFGTPEGWDEFYAHQAELGGEVYEDVQKRILDFFHDVIQGPEERLIICSHGDPLQFLYLALKGDHLPNWKGDTGEWGNPEYLRKGYIRPLYIEGTEYRFEPMITQDTLVELFAAN